VLPAMRQELLRTHLRLLSYYRLDLARVDIILLFLHGCCHVLPQLTASPSPSTMAYRLANYNTSVAVCTSWAGDWPAGFLRQRP